MRLPLTLKSSYQGLPATTLTTQDLFSHPHCLQWSHHIAECSDNELICQSAVSIFTENFAWFELIPKRHANWTLPLSSLACSIGSLRVWSLLLRKKILQTNLNQDRVSPLVASAIWMMHKFSHLFQAHLLFLGSKRSCSPRLDETRSQLRDTRLKSKFEMVSTDTIPAWLQHARKLICCQGSQTQVFASLKVTQESASLEQSTRLVLDLDHL